MCLKGKGKSGWWWQECTLLLTSIVWAVAVCLAGNMWVSHSSRDTLESPIVTHASDTVPPIVCGDKFVLTPGIRWGQKPEIQGREIHPGKVCIALIDTFGILLSLCLYTIPDQGFYVFSNWFRFQILGPDGSGYSGSHEAQLEGGSDGDEAWWSDLISSHLPPSLKK